jgi:hypothetical protein
MPTRTRVVATGVETCSAQQNLFRNFCQAHSKNHEHVHAFRQVQRLSHDETLFSSEALRLSIPEVDTKDGILKTSNIQNLRKNRCKSVQGFFVVPSVINSTFYQTQTK